MTRLAAATVGALFLVAGGCERGCARAAVESRSPSRLSGAFSATQGTDCPDGLARCEAGSVRASRLATLPANCRGRPSACACPWDVVGGCPDGCVVEGLELVVDTPLAAAQLCAPSADAAASLAVAWAGTSLPPTTCDEDDTYRCTAGSVVDCTTHTPVGRCIRGCYREGASTPDDPARPSREQAFALLCSR